MGRNMSLSQLKKLAKEAGLELEIPDGPTTKTRGKPGRPEGEFKDMVLALGKLHGWQRAHFLPAVTGRGVRTPVQADGKGFPDIIQIHEERKQIFVAELKVDRNKPTAEQKRWLELFRIVGVPTYLWYPKHWDEIYWVITGEKYGG